MINLRFHHIGYACRDLDSESDKLSMLEYVREGQDFDDPKQMVKGRFLIGPGPRIELLVQYKDATVLEPWLSKGIKMYHLDYEVENLQVEIDRLRKEGAKLIVQPMSAKAFSGENLAFLLLPTMLLVELIQGTVK